MEYVKHPIFFLVFLILTACDSDKLADSDQGPTTRLSWTAPTEREDEVNSQLQSSEILTYRVYYGSSTGLYDNEVDNSNVSNNGVNLINFEPGTYYFVVTTVDINGREGNYSEEIIIEF